MTGIPPRCALIVRFHGPSLAAVPDLPISFEVLADDFAEMGRQAREIASWGANVFVKIPVTNTLGAFPNAGFTVGSISTVGPSVGEDITRSAVFASFL